jgi:uncharacterized protein YkwD
MNSNRRILFFGLTGLFILIGLTSFSPSRQGTVSDVLNYTNEFRSSKKLPALIIREDLNKIAQKHSDDMARGRVAFGHDGFEKRDKQARKEVENAHRVAENVAFGAISGKEAVKMWKNSSGHRRNMLGPYKYIGIGAAKDRKGNIYYTQVFVD